MEKLHIGYVQGVHGLRGDLKVKNRFEYPEKIFVKNNKIYLNSEEHLITACKFYKGFYLVTIDNIKNINLVEKYIGYDVYFDRDDLHLDKGEYLSSDLLGLKVVSDDKECGKVVDVVDNKFYKLLVVRSGKEYMIPLVDRYIKCVDLERGIIDTKDIGDLML